MAKRGRLECGKGCGKDFVHPKRLENHEAKCAGTDGKKAASPRAAAMSKRLRADRAAGPSGTSTNVGGHLAAALEELRERRAGHEAEIRKIDELLPQLEKFAEEMGGGVSPRSPRRRAA